MVARALLALAMAIAAHWPALAQVILEIESRDHRVSPPRSETTFVVSVGQQLAMGLTSGNTAADGGMIYRGARREMVVLNHRDQTYMVFDVAMIERMATQMRASTGGQSFGQAPAQSPVEVRRTNDSATCFGYPATRFEIWRDGRKVREMWVTDWRSIDGGREVAAVFADMGALTEQMMAALPGGAAKMSDESIYTVMDRVDGFPVGVREYRADGAIEQEWALRSAKRQRIDPTTFSPPTGYRRQQMPGS